MRIEQALEKYVCQLRGNGRSDHTIGQVRRHVRLFESRVRGREHRARDDRPRTRRALPRVRRRDEAVRWSPEEADLGERAPLIAALLLRLRARGGIRVVESGAARAARTLRSPRTQGAARRRLRVFGRGTQRRAITFGAARSSVIPDAALGGAAHRERAASRCERCGSRELRSTTSAAARRAPIR
jgi:hypothetical protein